MIGGKAVFRVVLTMGELGPYLVNLIWTIDVAVRQCLVSLATVSQRVA